MTRRALAACAVLASLVWMAGCSPDSAPTSDVEVDLRIQPSPPVQGEARLSLRLTEADAPLAGARVRVEGNMSHAGMKPSFAALEEVEPGLYEGALEFTMGGDWFLIVTADTETGLVERVIEVPGVASM